MPAFGANLEQGRKNSPIAYDISERAINLPCALVLNEEQIINISEAIKSILKGKKNNEFIFFQAQQNTILQS